MQEAKNSKSRGELMGKNPVGPGNKLLGTPNKKTGSRYRNCGIFFFEKGCLIEKENRKGINEKKETNSKVRIYIKQFMFLCCSFPCCFIFFW